MKLNFVLSRFVAVRSDTEGPPAGAASNDRCNPEAWPQAARQVVGCAEMHLRCISRRFLQQAQDKPAYWRDHYAQQAVASAMTELARSRKANLAFTTAFAERVVVGWLGGRAFQSCLHHTAFAARHYVWSPVGIAGAV